MIYRYVDRGYRDTMALIPGWAIDHRVFTPLDIRYNYLLPVSFSPFTFEKDLRGALIRYKLSRISLLGHSMGGFAASEFTSRHRDLVDRLFLVSVRRRYPSEGLGEIRRHLNKSKRGYLYKFYNECFSNSEEMRWFKGDLLKKYCKELDLDRLLETLDYLEGAEVKPESLKGVKKLVIVHGDRDRIAPIEEAAAIKEHLPDAGFACIRDAGHMPFLKKGFSELV